MKTIEELAQEVGIMDGEGNILVHCESSEIENLEADKATLEALRQAIIKDFVAGLKPISKNDVNSWTPLYSLEEYK